jgi:hypothetical protein
MNRHPQAGQNGPDHPKFSTSNSRNVSSSSAASSPRLALSQLFGRLKLRNADGEKRPYPRLRNFVLDVIAEGRRKNIIQVLFEADIQGVKERLAEHRRRTGEPVSITSYVAKCFAATIAEDKRMQSYRLGKSKVVIFDDVDVAFLVEREWEGTVLPLFCIVRAADQKSAHEINQELQASREGALGAEGSMSALEMLFFMLPAPMRKLLWFYVRRNPYWFKDMAGTVAITSMGMFTSGNAVVIPITPMTLTLSIGSIEKKLVLQEGQVVERDFIHLNINVDHAVVDGAPLMRFVHRFKERLPKGPLQIE